MKNKLMKLAKLLAKFATISTDKAELTYDGELAEGVEVFVEVEGEMVAAEDGEYVAEDQKIVIKDGKVESIEVIESEPKPDPEPKPEEMEDEKDVRIAELEAAVAERDQKIQELEAKVKELEDKAAAPVEEPVQMNKVFPKVPNKENKALKYFE